MDFSVEREIVEFQENVVPGRFFLQHGYGKSLLFFLQLILVEAMLIIRLINLL